MVTPFARALTLLAMFTPQDRWLSARELAARASLPPSTVTRYTFASRVFLNRDYIEPRHFHVLINPAKIVSCLVVLFLILRFRIGHRESN